MTWTCTQFESVLSDYREGLLPAPDAAAARRHLAECSTCPELLDAVAVAQEQLARLPQLEPPARLMSALMAQAHAAGAHRTGFGSSWTMARGRAAWSAFTSPRFALSMAMSVFTLAVLLNAAQINLRQVFQPGGMSQLSPTSLVNTLTRRVDRAWARGVSYYHDLRVVYEIQAAVHQMRQAPTPGGGAAPPSDSNHDRSQRGAGIAGPVLAQLFAPESVGLPE